MRVRALRPLTTFATCALVFVALAAGTAPASAHESREGRHRWWHDHDGESAAPVALTSGLNNPRQLSLVDNHLLLIAEAGRGGSTCEGPPGEETCAGPTGSIGAVWLPQWGTDRDHTDVVTGLLSVAGPDGSFAVGSDGVAARKHRIYIQETFLPPDLLPEPAPGEQAGQLLKARPFGEARPFANITAFEQAHDPDGQGFDSNPYAVIARKHDLLVADAAGNDILRVNKRGEVSLFHVFPDVGDLDFVPTSLALGPYGDVFVGGLVGEAPGQAQVVELDGRSGDVENVWSGFTTVTGVAVGSDGSLYVSQLFAPQADPPVPEVAGVLTKVSPDGTRQNIDVPFPAGVAVDRWNNVYVAAFSVAPAEGFAEAPPGFDTSGQVWRLRF
jgi:hypothetical protein